MAMNPMSKSRGEPLQLVHVERDGLGLEGIVRAR